MRKLFVWHELGINTKKAQTQKNAIFLHLHKKKFAEFISFVDSFYREYLREKKN